MGPSYDMYRMDIEQRIEDRKNLEPLKTIRQRKVTLGFGGTIVALLLVLVGF